MVSSKDLTETDLRDLFKPRQRFTIPDKINH